MHVKLGRAQDFTDGNKVFLDAMNKANLEGCGLTYEAVAGAPAGVYLIFTMLESIKMLDGMAAREKAIQDAMGADRFAQLMKGAGDVFSSITADILQVKPGMSYVPQAMVDADPTFWKPKAAVRMPAAASSGTSAAAPKKSSQ
jgi:hypothetical protein